MNMGDGFSAQEIARLAGFKTTLMLNYLERSGTFVADKRRRPHHGKHRLYTFRDLIVLRCINQLLSMGARPKRISAAIATFRKIRKLPKNSDALLEFSKKASMLVVSKDRVYLCEPSEIIDLTLNGQLQMAFMLDVAQSMKPVALAAKEYEERLNGQGPHFGALDRIASKNGL